MSDENEPLPPELHDLVRGMRDDGLRPDEVSELARRLGPALGPSGGTGGTPPVASPLPWIAAGAVVVALAGLGVWSTTSRGHEGELVSTERAAAPQAPAAPTEEHVVREVIAPPVEAEAPEAVAPREEAEPTTAELTRPRRSDPARHAEETAEEEEHPMLVDARRALPSDPARALELADAHRARFPRGVLAPEREIIAIDALVALGRGTDASARAATLVERWPQSSYARRVRARGLVP